MKGKGNKTNLSSISWVNASEIPHVTTKKQLSMLKQYILLYK